MTFRVRSSMGFVVMVAVLLLSGGLPGAECFECSDDFEDGSVTDGDPCKWAADTTDCGGPYPYSVEDGKLILGVVPVRFSGFLMDELLSGDISVRIEATSMTNEGVGAFIHGDVQTGCSHSYSGFVNFSTEHIGRLRLFRTVDGVGTVLAEDMMNSPPAAGEMVGLQLDCVAGELRLYAWLPERGEVKPAEPNLRAPAGSARLSGVAGVLCYGQAAYDSVWILGPPAAAMGVDPESGPAPLEVTVDGSLSCACPGRNPMTYSWDFGDGTTAEGVKATHTYAEAGVHAVRLTVMDKEGMSGSATREVRVVCASGETGTWSFSDIGEPVIPGSAGFESGDENKDLHVCTSGKGIGSTSDECSMLYKEIAGDFRITARIASVDHVGSGGGVGVMVRESLDEAAIAEAMLVYWPLPTSSRRARCGYRLIRGESMSSKVEGIGSGEAPVWVRLEHRAHTMSAFYSLDGALWTPTGTPTTFTEVPETLLAGVAACKGTATAASPEALQAVITNLEVVPLAPLLFRRADANADGTADISDAITILGFLFLGGTMNDCRDAADVNDDGNVDISDPVGLLSHLFQGGPAPPSPFPGCGGDSTPDNPGEPINGDLGCNMFDECP